MQPRKPGCRNMSENDLDLIFFDVDDVPEEAEFIRVDDLFRRENKALSGPVLFTLCTNSNECRISGGLSRIFRRTLILSGFRLEKPVGTIRIRPAFAQWQLVLDPDDDPEWLAREFRKDLELQAQNLTGLSPEARMFAACCFVCPEHERINDDTIMKMMEMGKGK